MSDPINCDPNALMQAAKCFSCIPKGSQEEVMVYLLAQIAGGSTDPATLMQEAKCFKCIPKGEQEAVMTYLLCLLAKDGAGPSEPCGLNWDTGSVLNAFNIDGDVSSTWPFGSSGTTLTFPSLKTVTAEFGVTESSILLTLSCPVLTSIGTACSVSNNLNPSVAVTIEFPMLVSVGSFFNCSGLQLLSSLDVHSLSTVGASFRIFNDFALVTLNLQNLTTVGGDFLAYNCASLTNVNVPLWVPSNGTTIRFDGDTLSVTSVELLLRRCVLAGVTTCTIDLTGGTNAGLASLSLQGQADAATLGAQLTINP